MSNGKQRFEGPQPKRFFAGWTQLNVVSFGRDGRTPERSAELDLTRWGALDVHLTSYPATRANSLFMRLEEPSARALHDMLHSRFGTGAA